MAAKRMGKILTRYYVTMLAAVFVLFLSAFVLARQNYYEAVTGQYSSLAKEAGRSLASRLSFFYHSVQHVALNKSVRQFNRREAGEYFNSLAALYPSFDMIVLSKADGSFVAGNTIGADGEKLDPRILRRERFPLKRGLDEDYGRGLMGAGIGEFGRHEAISKLYDYDKYGQTFVALVRDRSGKVAGQVTLFANRKWLAREMEALAGHFRQARGLKAKLSLLNKDGEVLAASSESASLSRHFAESVVLSGTGWTLKVEVDKAAVWAGQTRSAMWFAGGFAAFALAAYVARGMALRRFERLWIESFEHRSACGAGDEENKKAA